MYALVVRKLQNSKQDNASKRHETRTRCGMLYVLIRSARSVTNISEHEQCHRQPSVAKRSSLTVRATHACLPTSHNMQANPCYCTSFFMSLGSSFATTLFHDTHTCAISRVVLTSKASTYKNVDLRPNTRERQLGG